MNTIEWEEDDVPRSMEFGDTYYARKDGQGETSHVFVEGNRLPDRWPTMNHCRIAELGFGTGLNFLETVRQWEECRPENGTLEFISFEKYPLSRDQMQRALSRWQALEKYTSRLLDLWSPETEMIDCAYMQDIRLVVYFCDANDRLGEMEFQADAWYLDGFAPSRNPELWNSRLLAGVHRHTKSGGTFATYTAAGFVRRALQEVGFDVRKVPGFGSKREMLVGSRK